LQAITGSTIQEIRRKLPGPPSSPEHRMRLLPFVTAALVAATAASASAQIDARLMRYPDVSATQIAFTYANDLWIVPKTGGVAQRLSTPKGEEAFARFSPDGRQLAFTANYDGNPDVYVLPVTGGVPTRV